MQNTSNFGINKKHILHNNIKKSIIAESLIKNKNLTRQKKSPTLVFYGSNFNEIKNKIKKNDIYSNESENSNIVHVSKQNKNLSSSKKNQEYFYSHEYNNQLLLKRPRRNARNIVITTGQSPLSVSFASNYKESKHKEWVKPQFSSIVYRLPVRKKYNLITVINI